MSELSQQDLERLVEVWEAAVLATHDFLREESVGLYRTLVRQYASVLQVTLARDAQGAIQGFIGLDDVTPDGWPEALRSIVPSGPAGKIEMLFVHPEAHGQGIGRRLVQFAESRYTELLVDVNEQNIGAIRFYERLGFERFARSPLDEQGEPYPLLHMRLVRKA